MNHATRQTSAWAAAVVAIAAFFMPWATMDIRTKELEKTVGSGFKRALGKSFRSHGEPSWIKKKSNTPIIPTRVSGFQIPILANRRNVKVVTNLAKIFTKKDEQLGLKSWAVYLVPGLAVLFAWLISTYGKKKSVALIVALLSAAVAGVGFWELLTTNTRASFAVDIGSGLWLSLEAYAVLSAIALSGLAAKQ